ncbi:MAG TPA: TraB/GumN family protein [Candidatus Nanoarchaeia archaeon]|nr:TraB/GumN family protein [Candidatus Nanoarchaeia archaeon]
MPLTIIGTSHIARESIQEAKRAIIEEKPDIIALELDPQRAAALLSKERRKIPLKEALRVGLRGYLFAKIGQKIQQKLGKMVGIAPGAEMKMGLELARKHQLQVALIDQPIDVTLRNFSKNLTWKEKFRFVGDVLKGLVMPKKQLRKLGLEHFDLQKVPEKKIIATMMQQFKERYPSIYKTLVEDRNRYMVRKLVALLRKYPEKNILALVGAGHEEGMKELLLQVDVV